MNTEPTIFTRIINQEIPGFIPYEDEVVAVLVALEGHLLIVPKTPYRDIFELPEDVAAHIMKVAVRVASSLRTITNCSGINLIQSNGISAGQEVFHFHMHVIPRYENDTVTVNWDTAVRPETERAALAEAIKQTLARL